MTEFFVKYLCVLDSGCLGNGHSINCRELNAERTYILRLNERRRRLEEFKGLGIEV